MHVFEIDTYEEKKQHRMWDESLTTKLLINLSLFAQEKYIKIDRLNLSTGNTKQILPGEFYPGL